MKNILTLLLIIACYRGNTQVIKKTFNSDSILIYQDYKNCGTTAHVSINHNELESNNSNSEKVNINDLETLNRILSKTKSKKLYQQKYGGNLCYLLIYSAGVKNKFVAYIEKDFVRLDNLDSMRSWQIKNQEGITTINGIINKYWE